MKCEFRFAAGDPDGARSTVWKIWINGSDVYVLSRMFGKYSKVSIHKSGECRIANTDSWVLEDETRTNRDRLIQSWQLPEYSGTTAHRVLQILIPHSELSTRVTPEKLGKVEWLPAPGSGNAVGIDLYIAPMSESDPAAQSALPAPCLWSQQLDDRRWLIVLLSNPPVNVADLESARANILAFAASEGIVIQAEYRAMAYGVGPDAVATLIEIVPGAADA